MEAQNVSRNVPTSALGDSAYIKLVFSNNIFSGLLICPQLSESAYKRRINAALSNKSINLSSTFRDTFSDLQSDEIFNVYGFCCAKITDMTTPLGNHQKIVKATSYAGFQRAPGLLARFLVTSWGGPRSDANAA